MISSIGFIAASAIFFGVAGYLTFATLWRLSQAPAPGSLGALFAREGVDWARLAASATVDEFALGLSRCTECRARTRCGEWLASGRGDGYRSFCPNAAFVERVTKVAMR